VEIVLTEALTNAFEHGCLGIDLDEKSRLITEGDYENTLESMSALPDAAITLTATLWKKADTPLLLVEVRDNGPGVPHNAPGSKEYSSSVNGRGFRLINRFTDSVFMGAPVSCLIILKTLETGGTLYAD
jgi:anti-sigma regulatory factor (Ser/Thr protein kinase)